MYCETRHTTVGETLVLYVTVKKNRHMEEVLVLYTTVRKKREKCGIDTDVVCYYDKTFI